MAFCDDMSGEKKHVLLATDQLPFPPRNGVTLPVYNYAVRLKARHKLRLLLLADESSPPCPAALARNEAIFGKIEVVYVKQKGWCERILNELLGAGMYKHGWRIGASQTKSDSGAEALIVSPYSAVAKWEVAYPGGDLNHRTRVAAVSDCTTAEYRYRGEQSFGSIGRVAKGILDRLRSYRVARVEARSLERFHHVLLQTQRDLSLMRNLVSFEVADRVTVVPNGIYPDFFRIAPDVDSRTAIFVAELSGEYAPIAHWLVTEVWPKVTGKNASNRLLIVGKGASPALMEAIRSSRSMTHVQFIDKLEDAYRQAAVAICPVFKGYGLINKALEAMASGVPVIGGAAAFNGIEGFENGRHGIVCRPRNADDFAAAIGGLMEDKASRATMGAAARELVFGQFQWDASFERLEMLLDVSQRMPD